MNIADSSAWLEYYASADQAEEFVNVIEGEEAQRSWSLKWADVFGSSVARQLPGRR